MNIFSLAGHKLTFWQIQRWQMVICGYETVALNGMAALREAWQRIAGQCEDRRLSHSSTEVHPEAHV